jgi:energy-converting hydrogenase Eha subunit A
VRADSENVKGVATLFACLAAVGLSLVSLFVLALAVYPHENQRRWSATSYAVFAAPFLAALLAWRAVCLIASNRPGARAPLLFQAAIACLLLLAALRLSSHSDGRLIAVAFAIELCAGLAFVLTRPLQSRHAR